MSPPRAAAQAHHPRPVADRDLVEFEELEHPVDEDTFFSIFKEAVDARPRDLEIDRARLERLD
jgi:hypothetical protein